MLIYDFLLIFHCRNLIGPVSFNFVCLFFVFIGFRRLYYFQGLQRFVNYFLAIFLATTSLYYSVVIIMFLLICFHLTCIQFQNGAFFNLLSLAPLPITLYFLQIFQFLCPNALSSLEKFDLDSVMYSISGPLMLYILSSSSNCEDEPFTFV